MERSPVHNLKGCVKELATIEVQQAGQWVLALLTASTTSTWFDTGSALHPKPAADTMGASSATKCYQHYGTCTLNRCHKQSAHPQTMRCLPASTRLMVSQGVPEPI